MGWLTSDLLTRIRLDARLDDADPDYTDSILLMLADDALRTRFSEVVQNLRQGHWVAQTSFSVVAGTRDYRLPARALGDAVVDVQLLDAQGVPERLAGPVQMDELEAWATESGTPPRAFAVVDQVIRLLPTPTVSGTHTLAVRYQLRRSQLVASSASARITAINTGTGELTCATVPGTYSTSARVDLVQAEPGFASLAVDLTPSAVVTGASGTITIGAANVPSDLAVGDYVTLRWQTPVVQLPEELHPALANAVAADVLSQIGDSEGAAQRSALAESQIESARKLLVPRVKTKPEVFVARWSPLRR